MPLSFSVPLIASIPDGGNIIQLQEVLGRHHQIFEVEDGYRNSVIM